MTRSCLPTRPREYLNANRGDRSDQIENFLSDLRIKEEDKRTRMARQHLQPRSNLPIALACVAFGTFTFLFPLLLRCVPFGSAANPFWRSLFGGRVTALEGQFRSAGWTTACPDMFRTIATNAKRAVYGLGPLIQFRLPGVSGCGDDGEP